VTRQDSTPGEYYTELPISRGHLLEEEIAWDFEDDVTDLWKISNEIGIGDFVSYKVD
jgi:hypothetical protein